MEQAIRLLAAFSGTITGNTVTGSRLSFLISHFSFKKVFSYPILLWGLPVAGLVVLIHLINMFRHRRVPWAAMEFLLAGYKKSRTRILLQQLLLMLLRCLAVVWIVLMLAQPNLSGPLAQWLGGGKATLHFVLLDDSYSMSDQNAGLSVMDEAVGVVEKIVDFATKNDRFSLLRFSRSVMNDSDNPLDFEEQLLDAETKAALRNRLKLWKASESSASPEETLAATQKRILNSATKYRCVVYLVSDYRNRNWETVDPLVQSFQELKTQGAIVRLIRTVDTQRSNLAIRQVKLAPGIRAAEIPLLLDVTVANYGEQKIENVHFTVSTGEAGGKGAGQTIPSIAAGRETTLRVPIRLNSGGLHKIQVQLEPDAVACDNVYSLVLDIPQEISVLLIATSEGNEESDADSGAMYLRTALAPEGVRTGIRVQTEPPGFLSTHQIGKFDLVIFPDVPILEPSAVRTLENYVRSGGNLTFFTGPQTVPHWINEQLYKKGEGGEGLFPVPILATETLLPDYLGKQSDLKITPHPMFRIFDRDGSSLLGAVTVEKYFSVEQSGTEHGAESETNGVKVLGRLRNESPLIFEHRYGQGKILTFLTTVAPVWNDWGRGNPSFVITMLEMVAFLCERRGEQPPVSVGTPICLTFDPEKYENVVRFVPPGEETPDLENASMPLTLEALSTADGMRTVEYPLTFRHGFYEAILTRRLTEGNSTSELRLFGVNVDPAEGDLALAEKSFLVETLHPLGMSLEESQHFAAPFELTGVQTLSDYLFILVVLFLVGEMYLAGRLLPPSGR